jgi:hypothetical protein
VEAGSNTSTVALRVVGGDKKGSLETETVKYGHESHGTLNSSRFHSTALQCTALTELNAVGRVI